MVPMLCDSSASLDCASWVLSVMTSSRTTSSPMKSPNGTT
jgi:hypothetical protein